MEQETVSYQTNNQVTNNTTDQNKVSFINHELDSDEHFKTSLFTIFSFPKNVPFKRVAAEIFKMGYESTFTQLLCVASITVLMMTVGKVLDLENYAAVGIGFSVFNIFCVAPTIGFASALDTLATAAYGRSPTGTEVGQLTQLGVGFGFLFTIPMCFFFLLGSDIFVAVVFGENYVAGACEFLRYIIPAALIYAPMTVIQKSLQAQLLSRPPMLATFFATISTAVGCFTLVPWFGIRGVALTLACTYGAQLVAMLFFAPADALYKKVSWIETFLTSKQQFFKVFSKANVSSYCAVGFTSMFAIIVPWYVWEGILVVAARMGETEVAFFNIFMNIVNLCWCFSAGFATSASSFVGRALGAGKGNLALAYARSTWVLSQVNMWCLILLYFIFNRPLAYFYTSEESVVDMLSKNILLVGLSMATNDLQFVGFAIYRGCGKQKETPLTVAVTLGLIGLPIGCLLAFYFGFGATGLLLGLAVGDSVKIVIQIVRVQFVWSWIELAKFATHKSLSALAANNTTESVVVASSITQISSATVTIEKDSSYYYNSEVEHGQVEEKETLEISNNAPTATTTAAPAATATSVSIPDEVYTSDDVEMIAALPSSTTLKSTAAEFKNFSSENEENFNLDEIADNTAAIHDATKSTTTSKKQQQQADEEYLFKRKDSNASTTTHNVNNNNNIAYYLEKSPATDTSITLTNIDNVLRQQQQNQNDETATHSSSMTSPSSSIPTSMSTNNNTNQSQHHYGHFPNFQFPTSPSIKPSYHHHQNSTGGMEEMLNLAAAAASVVVTSPCASLSSPSNNNITNSNNNNNNYNTNAAKEQDHYYVPTTTTIASSNQEQEQYRQRSRSAPAAAAASSQNDEDVIDHQNYYYDDKYNNNFK